jgi:hypothetical protein
VIIVQQIHFKGPVPLNGKGIIKFKGLSVTIGKSPRCKYILEHPAVVDQHAQIFLSQDPFWIKDLAGRDSSTPIINLSDSKLPLDSMIIWP